MFEEIKLRMLKFSYLQNNKRLKTQPDSQKQNLLTQKQITNKKPSRRYKSNLMDQQDQINVTKINSPSKFCPIQSLSENRKFNKRILTMPASQIKHPLKNYLNDLNIKTKFFELKKSQILKAESQAQSKKQSRIANINNQKQKNNFRQLDSAYKIIDEIYKKISRFKESGYTQKKINQWILRYCLHRRKYMLRLLMRPISKNKFSNQVDYFYEKDVGVVKQKILKIRKRVNGRDLFIDYYDLLEFSEYLEDILVRKNTLKVTELKESILQKLDECFIYNRDKNQQQFRKRLQQREKYNFISDLDQIEEKTGKFDKITFFNRNYYIQLGQSQKQIRKKVFDLINVTQVAKRRQLQKNKECMNNNFLDDDCQSASENFFNS